MRSLLLTSAALGALALGGAFASANAAPALGNGLTVSHDGAVLDKVWWKRVCEDDGDGCHRVWIRGDDDNGWGGRWRWRHHRDDDGGDHDHGDRHDRDHGDHHDGDHRRHD